MTYRLAENVSLRRSTGGRYLVCNRPLRALRVNRALWERLRDGGGKDLAARTPTDARAFEALARRGFMVRVPGGLTEHCPAVSVVIPVKDRVRELERCLGSLARIRYPRDRIEVVVVDDGSTDGSAHAARNAGAAVVASGGTGRGPATARNAGAQRARGEILAFVDSDCTVSADWLEDLVPHFADPAVAAVGGRVEGMHAGTQLDRYEAAMSSLSLGDRGRTGQAGNDTFYLPSCNLLVRRCAFFDAGGFRAGMHVGEDVDLTWRLRDRGKRILYVPTGVVRHEHRTRIGAFLRRRFEYGTSEAVLQVLHPRRRKRIALPPGPALVLGILVACALGFPGWLAFFAVAVGWMDIRVAVRRLRRFGLDLPVSEIVVARVRALGGLAYYVGDHLVRYYVVPMGALSLLWPPLALLAAAAVLGAGAVEYRSRRADVSMPVFLGLYLAERAAYGMGVFRGCLGQRSFGTYRPLVCRRLEMTFG